MIEDILQLSLVRLYTPETLGVVLALALSSFFGRFALSLFRKDDLSKLPLVNGKKWWQLTAAKQKQYYCDHAKDMVDDAFKNVSHPRQYQENDLGSFDNSSPASRLVLLSISRPTTASNFFYPPIMRMASKTTRHWILVAPFRK